MVKEKTGTVFCDFSSFYHMKNAQIDVHKNEKNGGVVAGFMRGFRLVYIKKI